MAAEEVEPQGMISPISKDYKLYVVSRNLMNSIAISTFSIVVSWLLISITGSPFYTGLANTFVALPFIFSFATGTVVNKTSAKRKILIVGTILSGTASLLLLFSLYENTTFLILIPAYLACLLLSISQNFTGAASAFFARALITDKQIKKGVIMRRVTSSASRAAGMLISGIMLIFSIRDSIFFVAATFFVSAATFSRTKYREPQDRSKENKSGFRTGLSFIFANSFFREVMIAAIIVNFFFGMVGTAMVVLVKVYFDLPAYFYSMMIAMYVVGDIIGSLVSMKVKVKAGKLLAPTLAAVGAIFISIFYFSTIDEYYPSLAVMFLAGFLLGLLNVILYSMFTKLTPKEKASVIGGTSSTLILGATVGSGATIGTLMQFVSPPEAIGIVGAVILIIGLSSPVAFRNIRKYEMP